MSLTDLIASLRTGIVQIEFYDQTNERIGGGSGFLSKGCLLTNHHVFLGYRSSHSVHLRREQISHVVLSSAQFAQMLLSGSMENSFDYAILDTPELIGGGEHQFILEPPGSRRVGTDIGILGFPLEHRNSTFHRGVISSFFDSGLTQFIQLDASVNAGNSGGPLFDLQTGAAIGMVTRKATGLTKLFAELRQTIHQNIQLVQQSQARIRVGGFDPVDGFVAGQNQMLATFDQIERQANVGIGYAISSIHLLADRALANR
jgi:Trypsin-like peptidase domain